MSLPSGYKQLIYIESTGTQWIDTGAQIGSTGAVQARFRPASLGSTYYEQRMCGAYDGTNRCFMLYNCFNPAYLGVGAADYTTGIAVTAGTDYSITCRVESAGTAQYDLNGSGTSISYGGTIEIARNLYLFCSNENGSAAYLAKARLYEFRLYNGSTKVRDFVPCINPNGAVGMYDEVSGAFYGNAGSGVFTAGPEVAVSKVVLGDGTVVLDLTTVGTSPNNVKSGIQGHDDRGIAFIGVVEEHKPTLTVTTNSGASVTATCGDKTVTGTADSSGLCVLSLPNPGEWVVTAVSGSKENSQTVMVGETEASVKITMPVTATFAKFNSSVVRGSQMVTINGTTYYGDTNLSMNVKAGSTITVQVRGIQAHYNADYNYWDPAYVSDTSWNVGVGGISLIYLNGVAVTTAETSNQQYSFTLQSDANIIFKVSYSSDQGYDYYAYTHRCDITME